MSTHRFLPCVLAAGSFLALGACNAGSPNPPAATGASASSSPSLIGAAIDRAMDKAATELASKNITISNHDYEPKAEITPQGDFLIADKPVPLTPVQRNKMLAYRGQLVDIARAGIAIGRQGAALGVNAASEAIAGAFSGESEQQIRARVEAKASGIRAAAAKICDRLPALMTSQQKLAADVPAFKPYADLTPEKIDECRRDALHDDDND
ncbi:MAG TPA: hypothetical protein VFY97_07570 [Rhodanobacteraceae bacterium]|nr:hypothetical protein [Rhodanobacteraceae bacterium]